MRNIVALLVIGLAGYGAYLLWQEHSGRRETNAPEPVPAETAIVPSNVPPPELPPRPVAPPPTAESAPEPASVSKTSTPDGVFFVMQPVSITTDTGIVGVRAGTQVKLVTDKGDILRVSDGRQEFDIARTSVTNDLAVIGRFFKAQQQQQADLARAAMNASQNPPPQMPAPAPAQPNALPNAQPDPQRQINNAQYQRQLDALRTEEALLRNQINESYSEDARENEARIRGRVFSKGQYSQQRPALQARLDANLREQTRIQQEIAR